ncbi:MAG: single-stranded DNA-binding protein [Clostridiales bacterium]|jgi:single-strand DNA-binding protein|nr:single-stranded DNA-binding protein [Clostridiales bacterium]
MNKVIIMGRLTKDPELKYTSGANTAVCTFTVAVDRRFKQQEGQPTADFLPVVTWGKTAEFCSNYFAKGRMIGIIGRIQTRTWDDTEGKRHYVTEIVGEEAYFTESKKPVDGGGMREQPRDNTFTAEPAGNGYFPIDDDEDGMPF